MADVDHPKTHVEDQDLESPRKQPESPKHEGIDPLTESDTMYPREDVKGNAEKLAKKENKAAEKSVGEVSEADQKTADTVADQQELNARANTPNDLLPESDDKPADENERGASDPESSAPAKDAGDDNAEVRGDKTDKETGTENTSASNKTTPENSQDDVKASEKKVSSKTPKA